MTAYRTQTVMVNSLRETMSHPDEACTLIRVLYQTEADFLSDLEKQTLTIRLHRTRMSCQITSLKNVALNSIQRKLGSLVQIYAC